jgi:hypothetical protein
MKIVIEGHRFDTNKAEKHYELTHFDGHNHITGDLFKSSKGKWYMWTPSQWANCHSWIMTSPAEILEQYRDFLKEDEIEEISQYVEGWE